MLSFRMVLTASADRSTASLQGPRWSSWAVHRRHDSAVRSSRASMALADGITTGSESVAISPRTTRASGSEENSPVTAAA